MGKYKPCYLKAIVIVHGKSEKQMCDYIKSNLRLRIEVISDKKGEKSIQINSLKNILKDSRFGTMKNFFENFDDVETVIQNKKKVLSPNFRIFIIMDTDDCTEKQRKEYIDKTMFKSHWAYDYIVPIYNSPDLENVLGKAKIKFEKKGIERKKEYIKIFPTSSKYSATEEVELNNFYNNLEKVKETNMDEFVKFCLSIS